MRNALYHLCSLPKFKWIGIDLSLLPHRLRPIPGNLRDLHRSIRSHLLPDQRGSISYLPNRLYHSQQHD